MCVFVCLFLLSPLQHWRHGALSKRKVGNQSQLSLCQSTHKAACAPYCPQWDFTGHPFCLTHPFFSFVILPLPIQFEKHFRLEVVMLRSCLCPQPTAAGGGVLAAAAATSGISSTPKSEGDTTPIKTEITQSSAPSDSGGGETVGSTSGTASPSNLSQSSAKDPRSAGEGNSSALHWLADLATQKAKDDNKGNQILLKAWTGLNQQQV